MARTRLLVAEDHKDMRERIVQILERDFHVVGVVNDGLALLEAASRMKPDICVVDISMPILGGIEAAIQLKDRGSDAKFIFVTVLEDPDYVRAALAVGASAYVSKSSMASDLPFAIKETMSGRFFISASVPYVIQNDQSDDV